jgi:nucleoside-diphosphate-sugar epimerase
MHNPESSIDLSGKSIFVTGGTGFVGSHFVERLLSHGCTDVRCLVRTSEKYLEGLPVTIVRGDLSGDETIRAGLDGVDFVAHIAALTRAQSWDEFDKANVKGTVRLLDAIRTHVPDISGVLVTSSLAAVGSGASGIADEDSPLVPVSMYGRSKKEMELAIAPFHSDLPICIIRPPAVYGPRESDIFTFFKTLSHGFCPIVGNGQEEALSLVHVDDLVTGMILGMVSSSGHGQTYFLGSPDQYSWHEIRDAGSTALGRRVLTLPIPLSLVGVIGAASEFYGKLTGTYPPLNKEKATEIRLACTMCDSGKAIREIGYSPEIDLWTGMKSTIEWYTNNGWL